MWDGSRICLRRTSRRSRDCPGRSKRPRRRSWLESFGRVLQFASTELKSDRGLVLRAVTIAGASLEYVSPNLQGDREVVETALKHSYGFRESAIITHASKSVRADRQLVRSAIEHDSKTLHIVSEELQMDPDIVALAWETMNEDHDYDLWINFQESDLRSRYMVQASTLLKELNARKKLKYFEVDDPHSTVRFAERWLSESLEKKWLTGEIARTMGILPELAKSVAAFAGTLEDLHVASTLLRFGSVLCHMKKGLRECGVDYIWSAFVADIEGKFRFDDRFK
mmetsp:Transcript_50759/g.152861  ORF Transcript_50759/g.152861 Transcript_50759/m.152861 type:complete len:282 (+) Transcript_50759:859-1704(+)